MLIAVCHGDAPDDGTAARAAVAVADEVRARFDGRRVVIDRRTTDLTDELPWAVYQALTTSSFLVDTVAVALPDTSVVFVSLRDFTGPDSLFVVRGTVSASAPAPGR